MAISKGEPKLSFYDFRMFVLKNLLLNPVSPQPAFSPSHWSSTASKKVKTKLWGGFAGFMKERTCLKWEKKDMCVGLA